MLGSVAACDHAADEHADGCDTTVARKTVGARDGWVVARIGHSDAALLGFPKLACTVERNPVGVAEVAKLFGFVARGCDSCHGDIFKDLSDDCRGIDICPLRDSLEGAPEHVHVACAAGEQTNTNFDKACVGLCCGLDSICRHTNFETTAERHAVWGSDDWNRAVLEALHGRLHAFDHGEKVVPLLLRGSACNEEEVCANAEVIALVGDKDR